MIRKPRWLTLVVLLAGAASTARADDAAVAVRRRTLPQGAPDGFLAVATLARTAPGPALAVLTCKGEGVELSVQPGGWFVTVGGKEAARQPLTGEEPQGLVAKRTPDHLLLGFNGRWVYGCRVAKGQGRPEVLLGVSPTLEMKSFRLVAREPVRFADDFPDPTPKTGTWAPVRGQWALSSLSFADKSANPAELAAVFDPLDDPASRGRTRQHFVGIGVQLGEGTRIVRMAGDSPAERAGLRESDRITQVDGAEVRNAAEATQLLDGEAGKPLRLTYERGGKSHTVELVREVVVWGKTRRQVPLLPSTEERVALIVTGYDFWTDYRFSSAVRTQETGAFGLVFAYLGPKDYHVFRWIGSSKAPGAPGRLQLERVRGGQRTVLASREGGFHPKDFYALSVEVTGDELGKVAATCTVDGVAVLTAADDALVPGRIGFWAEAPGAVCFDDVVVGERIETATRGTRNYQQLSDPTMRKWADSSLQWEYVGGQYWYKAPCPGDVSVTARIAVTGPMALTISAADQSAESGYRLEIGDGTTQATLKRSGKPVAERAIRGKAGLRIALARERSRIRVLVGDEPCLDFEDAKPLEGTLVGVANVLTGNVTLSSPNVVEDYFNACPTEWHVLAGDWTVMNRWVCDPTWSFFGGRNDDGLLAIWSKRPLDGDCWVDVDVGVMMMERAAGYENMRDVAVTFCARDNDLGSGYTVVVGADNNRLTALYRCGKLVASTTDYRALLPGSRNIFRGRTEEIYSQHRGWEHIRLAREGRRVSFYLWDRLCLSYNDPDPLPGGHAAVWSIANGLLVAKVRLAAERLGAPRLALRSWPVFADHVLTNDCCDGGARIVPRDGAYEVTNMASGGPFAVALRPRVFSAFDRPRLRFDIKLSPGSEVDLYFTCQSTLCRVPLAGAGDPVIPARTLGAAEGVKADGQWHSVSIDLLGEMRKLHPNDSLLMVWEPLIANFSAQDYLLAGLGGNRTGATYWLRNVSLASADEAPRVSQRPAGR